MVMVSRRGFGIVEGFGGQDPSIDLPLTPAAPAQARRWIETAVPLSEGSRESVSLLLSELVSNSVQHSGLGDDRTVGVSVWNADGTVHVEVRDPGTGGIPATIPDGSDHFGLRLVDAIADDWGYSRDPMTVWFELGT